MSGHDEILESFIAEATEAIAGLDNDFLSIEAAGASGDAELINKVFRNIHSIKGSAGFCGLNVLSKLAHEMENVLNLIRNNELTPTSGVIEVLLQGLDVLTAMIGDVTSSETVDISENVNALQAVARGETTSPEVAETLDRDIDVELPDGTLAYLMIPEYDLVSRQRAGHNIYSLGIDVVNDVEQRGQSLIGLHELMIANGEVLNSYVRTVGIGTLDDPLPDRLDLMVLFASTLDPAGLADALLLSEDQVIRIATSTQTVWGDGAPTEPESVDTPATTSVDSTPAAESAPSDAAPSKAATPQSAAKTTTPPPAAAASLRVNVQILDQLMTLAGELVLSRNQLVQCIEMNDPKTLDSVASRIDRVTADLQDAIMRTRMQPVGAVFSKFPRVVRDLGKKLDKECDLVVEGREVELDKSIIEAIADPLTHLIRNSIDHGVEQPADRRAKGKPEKGRVDLRAYHEAGKVVISIGDDGAGIDGDRLRRKAISSGMMTETEANNLDERDAVRLILHPGLSTAEQVTDVSGRGVGMDVVRTNIEDLGGSIDIDTVIDQGTTMTIRLPLTLAIIPSLIVRHGEKQFAVPQSNTAELIRIRPSEVATRLRSVKGADMLRLRGSLLPLVRLSSILDEPGQFVSQHDGVRQPNRRLTVADRRDSTDTPAADRRQADDRRDDTNAGNINIIVLENSGLRFGLIVDELHDTQEIVVKPLGSHLKGCRHLAGATILGNGDMALILDIAGIAAVANVTMDANDPVDEDSDSDQNSIRESQSVMLFSACPSETFAIPLSLVSRLERVRRDDINVLGDAAFMEYGDETIPLIRLDDYVTATPTPSDIDTLNLVVFTVNQKVFGLVAPTIEDIRDLPANIDTETMREDGILGSMVLDGRMVRFVDMVHLARCRQPQYFEQSDSSATGTNQSTPATLVLAEDSSFFRKQVESFLAASGYNVRSFEDGALALEYLNEHGHDVDLLVTDIEMPNMDGLELARACRSTPKLAEMPIIALTSLAEESDIRRGYESGIDDYQIKMNRDALLAGIDRLLNPVGAAA
ncbi:MAG: chemotaxis protein CheW [Planctomycetota bacterium]